jgi:membrane protein DedA with SNARE-associated domain
MRYVAALLAYVGSLALTFFAVLYLAGPHGGVLPTSLHAATLVLGWILVLVIPFLVAGWTWRRLSRARNEAEKK